MRTSNDKHIASIENGGLQINVPISGPVVRIDFDAEDVWELMFQVAHKHSRFNRQEVEVSSWCGCFHCNSLLPPSMIEEWADNNLTAICPECGEPAMIADKSGFLCGDHSFGASWPGYFLEQMKNRWYKDGKRTERPTRDHYPEHFGK